MTASSLAPLLLMQNGGQHKSMFHQMCIMLFMYMITILGEMLTRKVRDFNMREFGLTLFGMRRTRYRLQCNVVYKHNAFYDSTITLPFKAVMHDVYEKVIKDSTTKLKYHIVEELTNWQQNIKIVLFESSRVRYQLTSNLYLSITYFEDKSEKNDYTYKTYTIDLSCKDNDIKSVMDYVNDVVASYDTNQIHIMSSHSKVFILDGFEEGSLQPNYEEVRFETTKTFDNMFFDQKDQLLNKVHDFETSKSRYERLGIPYTLGFMFHGVPGTGKTSAIKAIAHLTKRHIVIIPVKKVNTADKLKRVFMTERMNDIKVPIEKRLYVFEEIDCTQWRHIVASRDVMKNEHCATTSVDLQSRDNASSLVKEMTNILKHAVNAKDDSHHHKPQGIALHANEVELTLGDLLDVLDGMVEMPGRMIIMTSNHPELIDTALLRPGRIDMTIEFKKMSKSSIEKMYKLWFNETLPENVRTTMKDMMFTQAEIGNVFSLNDKAMIHAALCASSVRSHPLADVTDTYT